MPIRKRRVRVSSAKATKGAGKPAPSASGGKGLVKRRSLPVEDEIPQFEGELGAVISNLVKDGHYGSPFIKASSRRMNLQRSRTGLIALDLCLGGGWTLGRAGMLYGEKSSGKSTTALQSIAVLHREDPEVQAAWIDVEGTFDKAWARKIGCDLERLVIVEPETGEHAVDLADAMLRAREIGFVALDSIAMLVSMKELDESSEQDTMALQARLVGKYIRRTNNALLKERGRGHSPILLHLNQYRMKVGLVFGDPRTLPGGKALEFSTTQQIETKNKEFTGKNDEAGLVLYNQHDYKITKNKAGGPMRECTAKLIRLDGYEGMPETWIDQAKSIYKFSSMVGIATGSAGAYEIDDGNTKRKFRGAAEFTKWALENQEAYDHLQHRIIEGFRKRWNLD